MSHREGEEIIFANNKPQELEYHIYQDDNAMSTSTIQEEFDKFAKLGWEFVGTVGMNSNHIVFVRLKDTPTPDE